MANSLDNSSSDVVELSSTDGVAFIEQASLLTRLHYFDGQFLRASALTTEQAYHRHSVQLANLAGGWGVVHGFGIALAGEQLQVSAGLAITPSGHFVLAGMDMKAKLADLLGSAQPAPPPGSAAFGDCLNAKPTATATTSTGLQVYEITIGPVEGLCGNEAVFGKLCEAACATDSRHPFWREGVVLRLRPINLALPSASSIKAATVHQRNRIASAYLAHEPGQPESLLSAAGLASGVWCEPAQLYSRDEVVIGLLWREAGVARIDAWSGRRERMGTQARSYWQGRMAMRPWNVFMAQILQFQCQLAGLFNANNPVILPVDDCGKIRDALGQARAEIEGMLARLSGSTNQILLKTGASSVQDLKKVSAEFSASYADLNGLSEKLATLDTGVGALPQQRMLLNAGFFELPPAGYLPVSTSSDVQVQCQRMFGAGCKLHFHAVHGDEIGLLVEEAAHMARISLTRGLDDPKQLEAVEIFVPEGQISDAASASPGRWWRIRLADSALPDIGPTQSGNVNAAVKAGAAVEPASLLLKRTNNATSVDQTLDGLIRTEIRDDASLGFSLAVSNNALQNALQLRTALALRASDPVQLYLSADFSADPFDLSVGGTASFKAEIASLRSGLGSVSRIQGTLTVLTQEVLASGLRQRLVQIDAQSINTQSGANSPKSEINTTRLLLQRDGDAGNGTLVIDDEQQDPSSSPLLFAWQDAPSQVTLSVDAVLHLLNRAVGLAQGTNPSLVELASATTIKAAANPRQQLMLMSALPAMPEPSSALGTATLNTLAAVAEANRDAALLLRSRRRLFPVLDAPKTQSVKARLDWVMFRRARSHLCGPACTPTSASSLETFQVWHLKIDTPAVLARLQPALDSGDAKTLAGFPFERIGILRYRDESAFSEETADRVVAMWQAAQPEARVALGRVWEDAPPTGQGWQNHMRLRNMVDQIAKLTQPPSAGDGSLAAIKPPPGILGDKALDGGLLLVTMPAQVQTHVHRTVLVSFQFYRSLQALLQKTPLDGLKQLEKVIADGATGAIDLDSHFSGDTLVAADAVPLTDADNKLRQAANHNANVRVRIFRVDATPVASSIHPELEQQAIAAVLKVNLAPPPTGTNDGSVTAPLPDLGRGAQVLTLVGYEDIS